MSKLVDPNESPEEKRSRIDELLRLNSQPPVTCFACKEPITKNQTQVDTQYGPYHGFPMTCIEDGDPNYEDHDQPYH